MCLWVCLFVSVCVCVGVFVCLCWCVSIVSTDLCVISVYNEAYSKFKQIVCQKWPKVFLDETDVYSFFIIISSTLPWSINELFQSAKVPTRYFCSPTISILHLEKIRFLKRRCQFRSKNLQLFRTLYVRFCSNTIKLSSFHSTFYPNRSKSLVLLHQRRTLCTFFPRH